MDAYQSHFAAANFGAIMTWFLIWAYVSPPDNLPDLFWVIQNAYCLIWWVILQVLVLFVMFKN